MTYFEAGDRLKRLGIIGGVGPQATARLYLNIVKRYLSQDHGSHYPALVIDNIPIAFEIENNFIEKPASQENRSQMIDVLEQSIHRLVAAGADCITLPCNTLHSLIEPIVAKFNIPFLNIVSATMKHVKSQGYTKVAILGTNSTRTLRVYHEHAAFEGIELTYPSYEDQAIVNKAILQLLREIDQSKARKNLSNIINQLVGIDCVVLACTDLFLAVDELSTKFPLIDSLECLIDACVNYYSMQQEVSIPHD
ncbi:aspartate/glutamate racemase family protein [Thermoactinomyces sp. DSM 45892]|uniref:aspartate/glutamate racemase family protein n=1 Tax=Thermoactinomyces sp. DSM 45892 TaxID=1882753 RepID=UPI000899F4CA|nr:amino acid racemase [Thermoactinomyces sp. DSM 45892]SDY10847.1 aspartate racemase [Thermoactinomyces sp. DSM 45892]